MSDKSVQKLSHTERASGAIYGHLCGDAFGVPYEFQSARQLPPQLQWGASGTHSQPPGTWSDDGSLMLCHVVSLVELGRFDAQDTGLRFVRWRDEGYMAAGGVVFDVGNTTSVAVGRIRRGSPAADAGARGESDNGNGSLMRVLPVALWMVRAPLGEQIEAAHRASRITHAHPRSQVCCAIYSQLLHGLMTGMPRDAIWPATLDRMASSYGDGREFGVELDAIRAFQECAGSGYVVDTLVSSWRCFIESSSYVEAVERAVRLGNDTDTTAAVAGSLAGAWWGLEAIPIAWRRDLRLTSEMRSMIDRFVSLVCKQAEA